MMWAVHERGAERHHHAIDGMMGVLWQTTVELERARMEHVESFILRHGGPVNFGGRVAQIEHHRYIYTNRYAPRFETVVRDAHGGTLGRIVQTIEEVGRFQYSLITTIEDEAWT